MALIIKRPATLLAALGAILATVACAAPATAGVAYTGLGVEQYYEQTNSSTSFLGADLYTTLNTNSASDFTGGTVLVPGQSTPMPLTWRNRAISNGTYGGNTAVSTLVTASDPATALQQLNASCPFGTYTFTAINSNTNASQTATLYYDSNHWATQPGSTSMAVPLLASPSYQALQGMSAASAQSLSFNAFQADGSDPFNDGQVDPQTYLEIDNATTGQPIYITPSMSNTTTAFTLPSKTLQPGTQYQYDLAFDNVLHCGQGLSCGSTNPIGYYLEYTTYTLGNFTTLAAAPQGTTVARIQGGTLADPTGLESEGRVGQVDGSIGGNGSEDFYRFYWGGGLFDANAEIYGASPQADYVFELMNGSGTVLDELTLNELDNYQADLSWDLSAGANYEIGLLADSAYDPNFSITFNTPIGNVPEPGTLGLLGLGLAGMILMARRGKRPWVTL